MLEINTSKMNKRRPAPPLRGPRGIDQKVTRVSSFAPEPGRAHVEVRSDQRPLSTVLHVCFGTLQKKARLWVLGLLDGEQRVRRDLRSEQRKR